jgi:hypothetical protein
VVWRYVVIRGDYSSVAVCQGHVKMLNIDWFMVQCICCYSKRSSICCYLSYSASVHFLFMMFLLFFLIVFCLFLYFSSVFLCIVSFLYLS